MSDDLHYLSAVEAIRRFRARTLSPVELMQAVIDRAEKCEPVINAFSYSYFERALVAAKRAEVAYAKGDGNLRPLEGIPLAVKDEASIAGEPTSAGTLIPRPLPTTTSFSVQRLLDAGAIVHARTTTPEFSCSGVTHSRRWGVTRNPWNPDFTPGGSSGGSAASLAAGSAMLATGSDIWGSIRIPASCCGVVGFKPPHGRVPEESPYNLDWYCHEGPLARTVADCALMENVIAGPHELDASSLWPKVEIPSVLEGIEGWRVAYSMDLGYCEVDPEVVRNTEAALDVFRSLGCEVVEVDLAWTSATLGAAQNHLGHLFGNMLARELPRYRNLMTHYARRFAEFSRTTTAQDFLDSMSVAGEMYASLGPILETHQVLICPTTGLPAVPAEHDSGLASLQVNGVEVDPEWGWLLTYPFNMMSRCPVMSVPSGRAANGVPTGIQIVGHSYDDVSVFRAAAAYETARGGFEVPAS